MVKPQRVIINKFKILSYLPNILITPGQAEEIVERLKPFNLLPLEKGREGKFILLVINGRELEKNIEECFNSSFTIKALVEVEDNKRRITAKASCLEGLFACIKQQINNL